MRRKGPTTDRELYDMAKQVYDDLGFNALNKELMRLEIKGIVHVSALMKGKRKVELVQKENAAA